MVPSSMRRCPFESISASSFGHAAWAVLMFTTPCLEWVGPLRRVLHFCSFILVFHRSESSTTGSGSVVECAIHKFCIMDVAKDSRVTCTVVRGLMKFRRSLSCE
eukprot:6920718-Lingulodinium_polyedra.AAC.1